MLGVPGRCAEGGAFGSVGSGDPLRVFGRCETGQGGLAWWRGSSCVWWGCGEIPCWWQVSAEERGVEESAGRPASRWETRSPPRRPGKSAGLSDTDCGWGLGGSPRAVLPFTGTLRLRLCFSWV